MRLLKVKPVTLSFPLNASGGRPRSYPAYSKAVEQRSDGGGTWAAEDPADALVDWPSNAPWSRYTACKTSCQVPPPR